MSRAAHRLVEWFVIGAMLCAIGQMAKGYAQPPRVGSKITKPQKPKVEFDPQSLIRATYQEGDCQLREDGKTFCKKMLMTFAARARVEKQHDWDGSETAASDNTVVKGDNLPATFNFDPERCEPYAPFIAARGFVPDPLGRYICKNVIWWKQ